MRHAIRYCTLVGAIIFTATLCYFVIQPVNRGNASSRLDILGHAVPSDPKALPQISNDGTGGWATRLFGSSSILGNASSGGATSSFSQSSKCPVYTYFDYSSTSLDSNEMAILAVWTRSFWALGFLPVVFNENDARSHPQFSLFRSQGLLSSTSTQDIQLLLMMAQRGGLFVDYHNIPMPTDDDAEFLKLGKCNFHHLVTYRTPDMSVVHGSRDAFQDLLDHIIASPSFLNAISEGQPLLEIPAANFELRPFLRGLATYSQRTVADLYPTLNPQLLPSLINAHLHEHFLRKHPAIVVLDPIQDTQIGSRQLSVLANALSSCPDSPLSDSCPPGSSRCAPCKPASIVTSRSLSDIHRTSYILAMMPHPYTIFSVQRPDPPVDARLLVETQRDGWVQTATSGIVEARAGSLQRIQVLKTYADALPFGSASFRPAGSWHAWEEVDLDLVQYDFGFQIHWVDRDFQIDSEVDDRALPNETGGRRIPERPTDVQGMVESWNLRWSEFWYYLRDLRRRQQQTILRSNKVVQIK